MIVFQNVSFSYGLKSPVLRDFSLTLQDGERVCLAGKSGIGKTTVLRIAMGLAKPKSGTVTGLDGLSVSAVFQEDRLIPWKTVLENVALFAGGNQTAARTAAAPQGGSQTVARTAAAKSQGTSQTVARAAAAPQSGSQTAARTAAEQRALHLLRALGLASAAASLPAELSGGMKRRAALARALAHPSDLLILDEAFTGLDDATKQLCLEITDAEAAGRSILMASHDLTEARTLGARIVTLDR